MSLWVCCSFPQQCLARTSSWPGIVRLLGDMKPHWLSWAMGGVFPHVAGHFWYMAWPISGHIFPYSEHSDGNLTLEGLLPEMSLGMCQCTDVSLHICNYFHECEFAAPSWNVLLVLVANSLWKRVSKIRPGDKKTVCPLIFSVISPCFNPFAQVKDIPRNEKSAIQTISAADFRSQPTI